MSENQSSVKPVLDFRPYGKVIGVDITWEEHMALERELIRKEEELISAMTEPESVMFCWRSNITNSYWGDIITDKSLTEVQSVIEEHISKIGSIFEEAKRKEDDDNDTRGFSMPSNYGNPIEKIEVNRRNPFNWKIKVQHKIPEMREGWREDFYEHCIKKDDRLYVVIEIKIYSMTEQKENETEYSNGKYYIYINRLQGHSHIYYDFSHCLKDVLQMKH